MFVPSSARRIRLARTTFVLAGLLPAVALAAWAVQRHSAAHRDAIRTTWEQAVGLPITVDSVEHPLPGVVRARGCTLAAADGARVLDVAAVEVETSPTEVRLGIGSLACDPAAAAALAGLATEWLERGARFRRDVVIDVADFAWHVPGAGGRAEVQPIGRVRIECVAQGGDRAVRIVRRDADEAADEVRIVRSAGADATAGDGRIDVEAACAEPVPVAILAAVAARVAGVAPPPGGGALASFRLAAARVGGRWAGTASGSVANVDLAVCTAALPDGANGTMDVIVRSLEWRDGRLAGADVACEAGPGRMDRRLLEALVTTVGCRAGAAFVAAAAEAEPAFDALACGMRIDGRGLDVAGAARLGGAVATAGGRPLLEAPAGIVPAERIAWLLAPAGAVYVPSSGAGAWLMSVLPQAGTAAERTSRAGGAAAGGGF